MNARPERRDAEYARKPMKRLDAPPSPADASASATGLRLGFAPEPLPAPWLVSADAPIAVRQARALSDDERLAAAAMYLWLRNRALDRDGQGPLVLSCDRDGWPVTHGDGSPQALDGGALDRQLQAALNTDR
jgi:hypothetical protein